MAEKKNIIEQIKTKSNLKKKHNLLFNFNKIIISTFLLFFKTLFTSKVSNTYHSESL